METLDAWAQRQFGAAARGLAASVSAVTLVKRRPRFGQTQRPLRGAIVASPVPADYDPEPDYFFHWYRDSALVIDALRQAALPDADRHFADFVGFSAALARLDGRQPAAGAAPPATVAAADRQYLRSADELAAVHDAAILGEARVNPDGTLDILRWARPQHDGPALRALAVLRWLASRPVSGAPAAAAAELLRADLAYTLEHGARPCYGLWEEDSGLHYHTLCVAGAALEAGADWLAVRGEAAAAQASRAQARRCFALLDTCWDASRGHYRARVEAAAPAHRLLDSAVVLAALHAGRAAATHSVRDARMLATLDALDALFAARYPINAARGRQGPALGRYDGDRYYAGGAYYFATFAGAELCYRAAAGVGTAAARELLMRGDAYLETVRAYTPANGELSEQFDQRTGAPASARQLAWSYAACLTCLAARRAAQ